MNAQETYMRLAISLAEKGCGFVNPNPLVGAVLVKDGRVIGSGYHARYGDLHAERAAFASLSDPGQAAGADLYVTLEPCCHYGKQPPCTQAILEHRVGRVFVGSRDPNPLVAGKGVQMLREHGIVVKEDLLKKECDALNRIFFHYIQTRQPYVVMKYAMTMDGKLATASGKSRWITGEKARERTHKERNRCAAILVGIGTVLADDPLLNCRLEGGSQPVRIVCDSNLRIPSESRLVQTAKAFPLWIACTEPEEEDIRKKEKETRLLQAGCEILHTQPDPEGRVDLKQLMCLLGERRIDSVLLEGGAAMHEAALQSQIVNHLQLYLAPKLFGGKAAPSPVGGQGVEEPYKAWRLSSPEITRLGEDLLLESEVLYECLQEL